MYEKTAKAIHQNKIIVIIRGVQTAHIKPLANALYKGGIRLIEVTFNQKNGNCGITETAECIKIMKESTDGHIHVGAGTVLTVGQLHAAASAGAEYIISPNVDIDVINATMTWCRTKLMRSEGVLLTILRYQRSTTARKLPCKYMLCNYS